MLNAIYQHLNFLLTFKHDGKGLKTPKSFTFVLIAICFLISLISYETLDIGIVIVNIGALLFLYMITNKDLVNGVLLGMLVFLLFNIFVPKLSFLLLFWILFATTKMQRNYTNNKH